MIYVDTSVLVAYYCPEPLSDRAEQFLRASPYPSISDLTEVEMVSALSRKVRERELKINDAQLIAARFAAHLAAGLYRHLFVRPPHYTVAREWIGRMTTPLRTLDALHLAVAAAEGLPVATADTPLAQCANAVGVEVVVID